MSCAVPQEPSATQSPGILHDILGSIPLRVCWKDRDSRHLGCSSLFARDAGQSRLEDVIGKPHFDLG